MSATDQDRILNARHIGRAMNAMVRLWDRAPLPYPFRLPASESWRGRASSAMEPDFIDGEDDEQVSEGRTSAALRALRTDSGQSNSDAGPDLEKVGEDWSVGRLRATCALLVHGDPRLHALVQTTLNSDR